MKFSQFFKTAVFSLDTRAGYFDSVGCFTASLIIIIFISTKIGEAPTSSPSLENHISSGLGIFFIIPCVDVYEKIDMRTQLFCVPPQEVRKVINYTDCLKTISKLKYQVISPYHIYNWICSKYAWCLHYTHQILTKDSVTVSVNAVMYYRVADAISAVGNNPEEMY